MDTSITRIEKYEVVKASSLPDGKYKGIWGGYEVTATIDMLFYRFHTKDGIRTPSAACTVVIQNGIVTVEI